MKVQKVRHGKLDGMLIYVSAGNRTGIPPHSDLFHGRCHDAKFVRSPRTALRHFAHVIRGILRRHEVHYDALVWVAGLFSKVSKERTVK